MAKYPRVIKDEPQIHSDINGRRTEYAVGVDSKRENPGIPDQTCPDTVEIG